MINGNGVSPSRPVDLGECLELIQQRPAQSSSKNEFGVFYFILFFFFSFFLFFLIDIVPILLRYVLFLQWRLTVV